MVLDGCWVARPIKNTRHAVHAVSGHSALHFLPAARALTCTVSAAAYSCSAAVSLALAAGCVSTVCTNGQLTYIAGTGRLLHKGVGPLLAAVARLWVPILIKGHHLTYTVIDGTMVNSKKTSARASQKKVRDLSITNLPNPLRMTRFHSERAAIHE